MSQLACFDTWLQTSDWIMHLLLLPALIVMSPMTMVMVIMKGTTMKMMINEKRFSSNECDVEQHKYISKTVKVDQTHHNKKLLLAKSESN